MPGAILPVIGAVVGTALAWIALPLIGGMVDVVVPVAQWLEVSAIVIEDADIGESPQVRVTRQIHRSFTGDWTVTLRHETGQGFTPVCSRHGRNDYRVDAVLPPLTTLDWWMEIPPNPPCPPITPGNYNVTIVWTLEVPGLTSQVVRAESNVFAVRS